jgi:hypothetical protein
MGDSLKKDDPCKISNHIVFNMSTLRFGIQTMFKAALWDQEGDSSNFKETAFDKFGSMPVRLFLWNLRVRVILYFPEFLNHLRYGHRLRS